MLNEVFGIEWGIASRWWGTLSIKDSEGKNSGSTDIELDVVAESIDRKHILIGECKWTSSDYADRLIRVLKTKAAKMEFFSNRHKIYVLFLRERPLDNLTSDDTDVHILYPDDVLKLLS